MKPRAQTSVRRITPAESPSRPRSPLKIGLALAAVLLACGAAFWSWRQTHRPGQAWYQKGMADMAAGRTTDAEQDWLQGVHADPQAAECYGQLGDLYLQQKRYHEAALEYEAAAKITPDDSTLFLRLNRAELGDHNLKAALAASKRAAQLRPDDPDAWGLYGLVAVKGSDEGTALAALSRALNLRPNDADYLLPLVRVKIDRLDMDGAEHDLSPYVRLHPTDPEACFLMATLINQKPHTPENVQTALDYARRAQAGLPDDRRVVSLLGDILMNANRPAEALPFFQAGLRQVPNAEPMLQGLVTCYTRLGQPQKAAPFAAQLQAITIRRQTIDHVKELVAFNPASIETRLRLAYLQEEDGDFDDAASSYQKAVQQAPHDPRARPALAAFYRRRGRPDLAAQALHPEFIP